MYPVPGRAGSGRAGEGGGGGGGGDTAGERRVGGAGANADPWREGAGNGAWELSNRGELRSRLPKCRPRLPHCQEENCGRQHAYAYLVAGCGRCVAGDRGKNPDLRYHQGESKAYFEPPSGPDRQYGHGQRDEPTRDHQEEQRRWYPSPYPRRDLPDTCHASCLPASYPTTPLLAVRSGTHAGAHTDPRNASYCPLRP
jgi:hypothetical protein